MKDKISNSVRLQRRGPPGKMKGGGRGGHHTAC